MKKLLLLISILLFALSCLCSCKGQNAAIPEHGITKDTTRQTETTVASDIPADSAILSDLNTDPNIEAYDEKVKLFLPSASKTVHINSEKIGTVYTEKTALLQKIGEVWYSWSYGYNTVPELYDEVADEIIDLDSPKDFPNWYVGSGSTVTLADRYVYEWLGYDDGTIKLTRVDAKENKLEVIRSVPNSNSFSAFINLCKIDDERFLSFYRYGAPAGDAYDSYSVCEIYDTAGNYSEILREGLKYNSSSDTDSKGFFYDALTAKDGEIYALGKEILKNEPKWSLIHFSDKGELIETITLNNFGYMAGKESVEAFDIVGDYFVTRDDFRTTCYVYKVNDGNDMVVVKGINRLYYTVTGNLIIVAIETDASGNPLSYGDFYVLNAESGEIVEFTFDLDDGLDSADLRKILVTDDGNLHFSFDYNSSYMIKTIPVEVLNESLK